MLELNGTIIAVILNFIILVWILQALLYDPVKNMLAARKKRIEDTIDNAEMRLAQAQDLKAEYEEKLKRSHQEAEQVIKKAGEVADKMRGKILEETKSEASAIRARAEKDGERIKSDAYESAKDELAGLITLTAGKLIKRTIDPKAHKELIDESIDQLGKNSLN